MKKKLKESSTDIPLDSISIDPNLYSDSSSNTSTDYEGLTTSSNVTLDPEEGQWNYTNELPPLEGAKYEPFDLTPFSPDEEREFIPSKKSARFYGQLEFPKNVTIIRAPEKEYQFSSLLAVNQILDSLEFNTNDSRAASEAVRNALIAKFPNLPVGLAKDDSGFVVNVIWFAPNVRKYFDYGTKSWMVFHPSNVVMI